MRKAFPNLSTICSESANNGRRNYVIFCLLSTRFGLCSNTLEAVSSDFRSSSANLGRSPHALAEHIAGRQPRDRAAGQPMRYNPHATLSRCRTCPSGILTRGPWSRSRGLPRRTNSVRLIIRGAWAGDRWGELMRLLRGPPGMGLRARIAWSRRRGCVRARSSSAPGLMMSR